MRLGRKIKHIRKKKGLNQMEFAQMLDLRSAPAVSKYELEEVEPSLSMLRKIAEIGKVELNWLIEDRWNIQVWREDPKLVDLLGRVERIYREGDKGKLQAVTYLVTALDPGRTPISAEDDSDIDE